MLLFFIDKIYDKVIMIFYIVLYMYNEFYYINISPVLNPCDCHLSILVFIDMHSIDYTKHNRS